MNVARGSATTGWWGDLARWAASNGWVLQTRPCLEVPTLTLEPDQNLATVAGALQWHPLDEIRLETDADSAQEDLKDVVERILRFVLTARLSVRKLTFVRTNKTDRVQKSRPLPRTSFLRLCRALKESGSSKNGTPKKVFPRASTELTQVVVEGFVWEDDPSGDVDVCDPSTDSPLDADVAVVFRKNPWASRRSHAERQKEKLHRDFANPSVSFG